MTIENEPRSMAIATHTLFCGLPTVLGGLAKGATGDGCEGAHLLERSD
jgi:hypothetical protein